MIKDVLLLDMEVKINDLQFNFIVFYRFLSFFIAFYRFLSLFIAFLRQPFLGANTRGLSLLDYVPVSFLI
jgi:hypothetical protein